MKKLATKFSLLSLFLLSVPAIASMADKYNNPGGGCTKATANYQGLTDGQPKNWFMCVKGNNVSWAYNSNINPSVANSLVKYHKGFIGKMTQSGKYLQEYAIEGQYLIKYKCKGYISCDGPIEKTQHAVRIK